MTKKKLAQAYYDLATMLDAGMPILRALEITIEGRQGYFKQAFFRLRETISEGSGLAEAMAEQRQVFSDLDRLLVEAAETSGSLGDAFRMLADWYDFMHKIMRRLQTGMILPFFILTIAAFVFPLPSAVLGGLSMQGYFLTALKILLLLFIPTAIVIACLLVKEKVRQVRYPMDFIALRVPLLGQAIYQLSICRYTKAFGMLYKAGVPMIESTTRANKAVGNAIVERQFVGGMESVKQGGMAWEGFSDRLPTDYRHLWQVGEEVGELDKTVDKIAEISGDRADLFFTEFARWLPRVVYAIVAVMVIIMIMRLAGQALGNIQRNIPTY